MTKTGQGASTKRLAHWSPLPSPGASSITQSNQRANQNHPEDADANGRLHLGSTGCQASTARDYRQRKWFHVVKAKQGKFGPRLNLSAQVVSQLSSRRTGERKYLHRWPRRTTETHSLYKCYIYLSIAALPFDVCVQLHGARLFRISITPSQRMETYTNRDQKINTQVRREGL